MVKTAFWGKNFTQTTHGRCRCRYDPRSDRPKVSPLIRLENRGGRAKKFQKFVFAYTSVIFLFWRIPQLKNVQDKISALLHFLIQGTIRLQNIEDYYFFEVLLNVGILKQASILNKNNSTHTLFTGIIRYNPSNNLLEITFIPN